MASTKVAGRSHPSARSVRHPSARSDARTSPRAPAALRPAWPRLTTVRSRSGLLAAPCRASRPARTARTALVGPRAAVCVAPAGRRAQSGCSNFWVVANKRLALPPFAFLVDFGEAFLRAAPLVHAKWRQATKRIVSANEPATKMPSSRAVRRISGSHGWRSLHGSLPEKHFRAIRLSCPRWSSRRPDGSSRTRGPSAWHSARGTGRLRRVWPRVRFAYYRMDTGYSTQGG